MNVFMTQFIPCPLYSFLKFQILKECSDWNCSLLEFPCVIFCVQCQGNICSFPCIHNNYLWIFFENSILSYAFAFLSFQSKEPRGSPSLLRVIWRVHWPTIMASGFLKLVAILLIYVSPICVDWIVNYVSHHASSHPPESFNASLSPLVITHCYLFCCDSSASSWFSLLFTCSLLCGLPAPASSPMGTSWPSWCLWWISPTPLSCRIKFSWMLEKVSGARLPFRSHFDTTFPGWTSE